MIVEAYKHFIVDALRLQKLLISDLTFCVDLKFVI